MVAPGSGWRCSSKVHSFQRWFVWIEACLQSKRPWKSTARVDPKRFWWFFSPLLRLCCQPQKIVWHYFWRLWYIIHIYVAASCNTSPFFSDFLRLGHCKLSQHVHTYLSIRSLKQHFRQQCSTGAPGLAKCIITFCHQREGCSEVHRMKRIWKKGLKGLIPLPFAARMFFQNHMGVSKNRGTPKSSVLIGFSIINHPFWGTIIFGNTHIAGSDTKTPGWFDAGHWIPSTPWN